MMMIGYEEEDPENSYYSYQQRIIKGLVRSSFSSEWIFLCNDNVMVFPENLSRYYEKLDPNMPIIIGRVSSTASKSLSDAIASSIGKIIFSSGTTNFNEDSSTKKEQQNKMIKYKVHPNNVDSDNNNHQITWISAFGSSSPGILVSRYIFHIFLIENERNSLLFFFRNFFFIIPQFHFKIIPQFHFKIIPPFQYSPTLKRSRYVYRGSGDFLVCPLSLLMSIVSGISKVLDICRERGHPRTIHIINIL
jgi:hypothetical protein